MKVTSYGVLVLALAASGIAAQQFRLHEREHLPRDPRGSVAIISGDLDGDGDDDLVVRRPDHSADILWNDGNGRFSRSETHLTLVGHSRGRLALGDVDGDDDLDLLIANSSTATTSPTGPNQLLLNNGRGHYTDVSATRLPRHAQETQDVLLVDVDGDRDLDVVVGNSSGIPSAGSTGFEDRLYLNDGRGFFTDASARLPGIDERTLDIAAGDVDGDGDPDLFVAGRTKHLFLNDGNGFYRDATTQLPASALQTTSMSVGDIDGDGDVDLFCGNSQEQNELFRNDGSGRFEDVTATHLPAANDVVLDTRMIDLDRDGDLDLVIAGNRERIQANDGTGVFREITPRACPPSAIPARAVAAADFDQDGDVDLALAGSPDRLYLDVGRPRFLDGTRPGLPEDDRMTAALTLADFDQDGDLDVATVTSDSRAEPNLLYINDGLGWLQNESEARLPPSARRLSVNTIVAGDLDGDGDADLLSGGSLLYLNDGTGHFTDRTTTNLPPVPAAWNTTLGDLDGDGDLDLVGVRAFWGAPVILINDGRASFVEESWRRPQSTSLEMGVALADVDGDGDDDMLIAVDRGPNRLLLNDGTGVFRDASSNLPPDSDPTRSLAIGDVDGDDDLDVVWSSDDSGSRSGKLHLNDGTGIFVDATAQLPPGLSCTFAVDLGDVDEDGDLDLVCAGRSRRTLALNDGTGRFDDATATRLPFLAEVPSTVVLADTDGDRDLDLVVGNAVAPSRIYGNGLRQLEIPHLARPGEAWTVVVSSRRGFATQPDFALVFAAMGRGQVELPGFGTFGLDPATTVLLGPLVIPAGTGSARVRLPVPALRDLAGRSVFAQALVLAQDGGPRLTNVGRGVVQ